MFVLASNHFWKCFSINAGVWLRMENKVSGNAFQLTMCFSWFGLEMVWSENFHFKPFPNSHAKRDRDHTQITPRTQSLEPFDFAPFDFDFESHPKLRIARLRLRRLRAPSTSPRSHPRISRLRLRWLRTPSTSPRWHQDGTDRTEIAIEKWLGFDEFDRIWWIFFGWVLFLCLSTEKWYYIFVWKLRKCEEQEENVFSILFSATQPNIRKYFSKHFLECNQVLENIFLSQK